MNGCSRSMDFDFYDHPRCHSDFSLPWSLLKDLQTERYFESAPFTFATKHSEHGNSQFRKDKVKKYFYRKATDKELTKQETNDLKTNVPETAMIRQGRKSKTSKDLQKC